MYEWPTKSKGPRQGRSQDWSLSPHQFAVHWKSFSVHLCVCSADLHLCVSSTKGKKNLYSGYYVIMPLDLCVFTLLTAKINMIFISTFQWGKNEDFLISVFLWNKVLCKMMFWAEISKIKMSMEPISEGSMHKNNKFTIKANVISYSSFEIEPWQARRASLSHLYGPK